MAIVRIKLETRFIGETIATPSSLQYLQEELESNATR